jgi:hypothetical protein
VTLHTKMETFPARGRHAAELKCNMEISDTDTALDYTAETPDIEVNSVPQSVLIPANGNNFASAECVLSVCGDWGQVLCPMFCTLANSKVHIQFQPPPQEPAPPLSPAVVTVRVPAEPLSEPCFTQVIA